MPSPHRQNGPVTVEGNAVDDLRGRALEVLLSKDLAHVVELVAWVDGDWIHAANSLGESRLLRADPSAPHEVVRGDDPIARQDPLAFTPPPVEAANPRPGAARQHYPHAGVRLAAAFLDPTRSPDLTVVHTDAHFWGERGGHLGEHGSLGVFQSRAPFLLSGAGVTARGVLQDSARTVDVMPTLATLAGVPADQITAMKLDGRARTELLDLTVSPKHVVGLLWDGANAQDLLLLADAGELPAVARLRRNGCVLAGGAVAEFPSVTLANHTSALTGVSPGRHGIVNNEFFDRELGVSIVANGSATWHTACSLLRPGVRTLWEVVAQAKPGIHTACVDEPIDRGASYSTFALVRELNSASGASSLGSHLPDPTTDENATQSFVGTRPDYAWSSQVDAMGLTQLLELWNAPEPPALTWCNTTLTDTGHHGGGPRSPEARAALKDSDTRLGIWLDLLESRGLLADTVILLTADHGSAAADPDVTGDWDKALANAGVPVRDGAYGWIYFA